MKKYTYLSLSLLTAIRSSSLSATSSNLYSGGQSENDWLGNSFRHAIHRHVHYGGGDLQMKICAHMHLSPYSRSHMRFDSVCQAKAWLWNYLYREGMLGPYDPDHPCGFSVNPQCDDCNSEMNFHDYPMYLIEVGPRGGIRKVRV